MALLQGDPNHVKEILKEVNETHDGVLEVNKKLIKEWLNCQPHLPHNYDERVISTFLRGCRHDLERTKQKLEAYFTVRSTLPEVFQQRDPRSKEIQAAARAVKAFPLPQLTPNGCRVTLHQITTAPLSDFEPSAMYKTFCMIGDIRLIEEVAISGDIFLFDIANLTLNHITKLAHPLLKKIVQATEQAYPQRLKQIHIINAPPFADRIVNMFKMFMKEKIRNRFYIHSGYKTLYDYIPQSMLPEEYGGDGKSVDVMEVQWLKKLESYSDYFEKQDLVRSDESLRPIKNNTSLETNSLFGCEGAFRQLNID